MDHMLDKGKKFVYNIRMNLKSIIAFLLGMLTTAYVFPATPSVSVSDMDRREIAYEVIEWLDDADWNKLTAKRNLITEKKNTGWW